MERNDSTEADDADNAVVAVANGDEAREHGVTRFARWFTAATVAVDLEVVDATSCCNKSQSSLGQLPLHESQSDVGALYVVVVSLNSLDGLTRGLGLMAGGTNEGETLWEERVAGMDIGEETLA